MKKPHKVLMIVGIVIASLALLVVGAGFYLQTRADNIIKREFSRLTDGRYQLDAGRINVSLWRRSLTLNDIRITPIPPADSTASPKMVFSVTAEQLFVTGINFKKRDGKIDIGISTLQLRAPKIKIREYPHNADIPKDTAARRPVKIDIGRIILNDGAVEHTKIMQSTTVRNIITGIELEIDKFLIDNDSIDSDYLLGNNTRLTITKITHLPKDQSTRLELDSIYIETAKQLLTLSRFALVPTYSKNEFARKSWRHTDWTRMTVNNIACNGLDYNRFLEKGVLKIDSITVGGGEISSYKNRNVKRNEWVKTLFQQKIQRLPVKLDVGKVMIGRFNARYEELALGASEPGRISFDKLCGTITNLTNITPSEAPFVRIEAAGMVNNSGPLSATIFLPVDSLNNRFEVAATLGRTNLPDMNTMITPLVNVVIDSGIADQMTVQIEGTTTHASAEMTFLYHDLQVMLLREKNNVLKERKFLSNVVNTLVIKNSNPGKGGVRTAHTETDRDPYRSPLNFLWHTIFDGLKETVGL